MMGGSGMGAEVTHDSVEIAHGAAVNHFTRSSLPSEQSGLVYGKGNGVAAEA